MKFFICFLSVIFLSLPFTLFAQNYLIPWDVINEGGLPSTSSNYQEVSSIGEAAIGFSQSANYQEGSGFCYGIETTSSPPSQPQISVTPSSFNLSLQQGQSKDTILRISNTGTANLSWSLTEVPLVAWLSENPTSGNIPASGQTNVTVSFNTSGLSPATYLCTLRITSNDPVNPIVNVPVELEMSPPLQIEILAPKDTVSLDSVSPWVVVKNFSNTQVTLQVYFRILFGSDTVYKDMKIVILESDSSNVVWFKYWKPPIVGGYVVLTYYAFSGKENSIKFQTSMENIFVKANYSQPILSLPYPGDVEYICAQRNGNSFTHNGATTRYALDFSN
ncbi:MAG: hypothetical protein ABIK31_07790, partial [candidate division WOR-3 bacterium]